MSRHSARSHAYRKATAELRARRLPCWLCGQPIDYDAPPRTPSSFSADHRTAMAEGGYPTEDLMAAHYGCNASRGARAPRPSIGSTSEAW